MSTVLVIDTVGESRGALEKALGAAGWEVRVAGDPEAASSSTPDAVVLAVDATGLGTALPSVREACSTSGAPLILVADLDRSGWDRTFGSAGALEVDALLNAPVDAAALVRRLQGILSAREAVKQSDLSRMADILDRAVANEEASAAFYRKAAQSVSDPRTRDVLEGLMRDEEEHKQLIEQFRSGSRPLPEGPSSGGSLVEAFGTPEFSTDLSPADAFLLAARKEKVAVEFYENWAALYPEGPERDLLLRLAEVEGRHKERVEAMFSNAAFPEVW